MAGILSAFVGSHPMRVRLQYLVIAGGGGGGWTGNGYAGGGGGAGGYIEGSLDNVKGESFNITIGSGGTTYYTYGRGQTGGNSVLSNGSWFVATALGGGGGGGVHADGAASGGSGGAGSAYRLGSVGAGLQPSQTGYSQGFGSNGYNLKGGGAGGINGYPKSSDITGTTVYYAGGGNGLGNSSYYGDGGNTNTVGKPGIVILRSNKVAKSYTGSPAISSVGADTVYTFTGAGSITF